MTRSHCRPGRFDRQVVIDCPDINGREAILKIHARNVHLGPDVDLHKIARLTQGFVGADLASLAEMEREIAIERIRAGLETARKLSRRGGRRRQMTDAKSNRQRNCWPGACHPEMWPRILASLS